MARSSPGLQPSNATAVKRSSCRGRRPRRRCRDISSRRARILLVVGRGRTPGSEESTSRRARPTSLWRKQTGRQADEQASMTEAVLHVDFVLLAPGTEPAAREALIDEAAGLVEID